MDIKSLIEEKNKEYLEAKRTFEEKRASLNAILEEAQKSLNEEVERFKREEEELLSILDATKKERLGEIERVAIEKIDILKAEREKLLSDEGERLDNVKKAYNERFEGLEREHSEKLEYLSCRYERMKNNADSEYEQLKAELESSLSVRSDVYAMINSGKNRDLIKSIEEQEKKNGEIRSRIYKELDRYKEALSDYLKLGGKDFVPPSRKKLLELAEEYYKGQDRLEELNAQLKPTGESDPLVKYNEERLQRAKEDHESSIKDISEWYASELERENENYSSEKAILERQMDGSGGENQEVFQRAIQIDNEIERLEKELVEESGRLVEDLSRGEGAKTRMFNLVKADELRKHEELLQQAKTNLKEFCEQGESELAGILDKARAELGELIEKSKDLSIGQIRDYKGSVPKIIPIGDFGTALAKCELLEEVYGSRSVEIPAILSVDVQCGEAVILKRDGKNNDYLDKIIGGLTLKYLEEFPLGDLSVKIISRECPVLDTIRDTLSSELVTISSEPMEILAPLDTGLTDKEHTLLVIRDKLTELLENAEEKSILRKLLSENGVRAGVRLIIVCDKDEELLNTGVKLEQRGKEIFKGDSKITPCMIPEGEDSVAFVRGICSEMASLVNGKNEQRVTYNDLGFDKATRDDGEVMLLPIGVSNGKEVCLKLSCKAEDTQLGGCLVLGEVSTGKSSLLHSIVINGCMQYSRELLELWLLDFKKNGAVGRYISKGLPHVRLAKDGCSQWDIYYTIEALSEEIERRKALFASLGKNTVYEYNEDMRRNGGKVLPRIVVVLDEAQALLEGEKDQPYSETILSLAQTVLQGRCAGVHFIIIANGEVERNPVFNQIKTMICFRLEKKNISGMALDEKSSELSSLKRGEAYLYCKGESSLVKTAYATSSELEGYIEKIKEKYKSIQDKEKCRFVLLEDKADGEKTYAQLVRGAEDSRFTIGENDYSGLPVSIELSKNSSSMLVISENKTIQSSILACMLVGISKKESARVLCCNGEEVTENVLHPILEGLKGLSVRKYERADICELVRDAYAEYLERRKRCEADEEYKPSPLYVMVNRLSSLSRLKGSISTSDGAPRYGSAPSSPSKNQDASIEDIFNMLKMKENKMNFAIQAKEQAQKEVRDSNTSALEALYTIATLGGKYGIYVIASASQRADIEELAKKVPACLVTKECDCDGIGIVGRERLASALEEIKKEEEGYKAILVRGASLCRIRPISFR